MKKTLIYKLNNRPESHFDFSANGYQIVVWKPSWKAPIPPKKPKKYIFYFLFHILGIFFNRSYRVFLVYSKNGDLATSFMLTPAHFKWPFMDKNDAQIMYVMTSKTYRGQGLAEKAIRYGIMESPNYIQNFWYVTDTENIPSIKTTEKIGFSLVGYGKLMGFLKTLNLVN